MGMVAEYKSKFVILANRVTGISESLLTPFYISGLKLTLQIDLLRARPINFRRRSLCRSPEYRGRFEDERVPQQDRSCVTSMLTTYEEHGCQDGFCMVATYEEQGSQDGLKPVTTKSPTGTTISEGC
ncbi:hypothetical protein Tco_0872687 [Tanacetum coccineum]